MELITKMWAPLALQYVEFLNRYKIETISIIIGACSLGIELAVFANAEEYLKLTETNDNFNKEEAQLTNLFGVIRDLTYLTRDILKDYANDNQEPNDGYECVDYDDEEDCC